MGLGILLGKRNAKGYRPSLAYRLLKPRISGNAINGLGEEKRRRASPIYHWAELGFPHKRVWRLFLLLTPWMLARLLFHAGTAPIDVPAEWSAATRTAGRRSALAAAHGPAHATFASAGVSCE